jgi:2-phospho-L-lactate guanylyltransferase
MTGWSVVVPLKPLHLAKSRLRDLPTNLRRALVVAMARDVRDAVLACPTVEDLVVVTGDLRWHNLLGTSRVRFVADSRTDSLNEALRRGASACRTSRPGHGFAALTADLPALRPDELERALDLAVGTTTAFVPDANGDGTTTFAACSYDQFWPQFGAGSRTHHREAGALEILSAELAGLRQDVDTVEDLEHARTLGLGAHTEGAMVGLTIRSHFLASRPPAPLHR